MSPSPAAVKSDSAQTSAFTLSLIALCFVLSGAAALIYQTAWTRQFSLVFGTSELAVATVLAAYMGGLALGAWLVERFLPRVNRPVLAYAALELGIAVSALLIVPALLFLSRFALVQWFGGQAGPPSSEQVGTSFFYLISAFVALALPTTLMGATLPLLARHAIHAREQIGRRIGMLYAANTAGAVAGALGAAFVLLPAVGLNRTVWIGAALNLLVFLLAAFLVERERSGAPTLRPATDSASTWRQRFPWSAPPSPVWVLPLMLVSGAVAFTHEVLWVRMLSHIVGSSIYAFGVMVSSFLAGIALGGAAGALLARDRAISIWSLAAAQFAAAVWGAVAFLLLDAMVPDKAGLASNAFLGFLLLLPLTFAIGLTYPLAVRVLADRPEDAAAASARVYAWNTVGAIAGSLAAGFAIIPALRYEGTIQVAVAASAILAVLTLLLLLERRPLLVPAAAAVVALVGIVGFRPEIPERLLRTSPLNLPAAGPIVHYEVGRSASVVMLQQDGGLALRTNGLPEALMDSPGMAPRFSGEFWMSSLAVVARPDTRSMLIVGYGGGVVVEGVPPSVRAIDVIELEPEVIAANRATRPLRRFDPLSDPRLNIITNDARGALSLTSKRYDAIVSQPSHPWTAGASHLYTREFMSMASDHLTPSGVFVQWMNVAFLDEALLKSLTATLVDVFPNVRIYRPDPSTLVFLASASPFDLERRIAANGTPLVLTPAHYARFGINSLEDLIAALAVDEQGARELARGATLIEDDTNRMATSSVYELSRGLSADATGRALVPYDPLQRKGSWIYRDLAGAVDFSYIARRNVFFRALDPSMVDRVRRMGSLLAGSEAGGYIEVLLASFTAGPGRSQSLARELLAAYPQSSLLRYTLLQPQLGAIARGEPGADTANLLAGLPPSAVAVAQGSRALELRRFADIAQLDGVLAEAKWTDLWYADATQLRAEWRSRVVNEDQRRRLSDEAITMLDRLSLAQPSQSLYALRTRAALNADRPDVLAESVWNLLQWTLATTGNTPESRARARATLTELKGLLEGKESDPRVDARRVLEIRERVEESLARIS